MTKEEIRERIRRQRQQLDSVWVERQSTVIQRTLLETIEAMTPIGGVCNYLSGSREAQTDVVTRECWARGWPLYVPAFYKETGQYRLAEFDKNDRLESGLFGIAQPVEPRWASLSGNSVIVVPGVAFDCFGGRIGHGGGHYDRLLTELDHGSVHALKIGLAFEFQIVSKVPMDEADVYMDVVITDKRKINPALSSESR
ncbi:MAG: 5-formyltetrahydrofolate cyclo-ligase [Lentisphaerae bacterium]|nr:5-formyltetrahydrofolate cyclo-ligase [Lentisphaerota bacterium]